MLPIFTKSCIATIMLVDLGASSSDPSSSLLRYGRLIVNELIDLMPVALVPAYDGCSDAIGVEDGPEDVIHGIAGEGVNPVPCDSTAICSCWFHAAHSASEYTTPSPPIEDTPEPFPLKYWLLPPFAPLPLLLPPFEVDCVIGRGTNFPPPSDGQSLRECPNPLQLSHFTPPRSLAPYAEVHNLKG